MEMDTIFRIYSMTKPVTGVAMMILHEQGLWDLDDPVSQHIPEFEGLQVAVEDGNGEIRQVPQDHPMTMRELMTHTGGLTYGYFSQSAVDTMYLEANVLDRDSTLQAMIDKLADIPLRWQPGSLWHYSVSVDVQGYIVEKLSAQTLPQFFEERIFDPLGMEDSGFYLPAAKADRLAPTVYDDGPDGKLIPSGSLVGDYSAPPRLPSGGGGMVSTVSDYMRFAQMLLNRGEIDGARIMSTDSVDMMRANHAATTTTPPNEAVQLPPGTGLWHERGGHIGSGHCRQSHGYGILLVGWRCGDLVLDRPRKRSHIYRHGPARLFRYRQLRSANTGMDVSGVGRSLTPHPSHLPAHSGDFRSTVSLSANDTYRRCRHVSST